MKFREVVRLREFDRDIRTLSKRYSTLEEDLDLFVSTSLVAFHRLKLDMGIVRIEGLGKTRAPVFKARKFACRALKGRGARSGIRVTYAFDEAADRIELIAIYSKADAENEDQDRILKYFRAK